MAAHDVAFYKVRIVFRRSGADITGICRSRSPFWPSHGVPETVLTLGGADCAEAQGVSADLVLIAEGVLTDVCLLSQPRPHASICRSPLRRFETRTGVFTSTGVGGRTWRRWRRVASSRRRADRRWRLLLVQGAVGTSARCASDDHDAAPPRAGDRRRRQRATSRGR